MRGKSLPLQLWISRKLSNLIILLPSGLPILSEKRFFFFFFALLTPHACMLTHFSFVWLFVTLQTIAICQAPLPILTSHNNVNQISLSEKMAMLNSFQLLWPLYTRALWTCSLVWGEGGWVRLRKKFTSSTSFVEPPIYVCMARVPCIWVSNQFSHSVVSDSVTQWTAVC